MMTRLTLLAVLVAGGLASAQEGEAKAEEPVITFSDQEIKNFILTFEQTYKNKDLPQEDAVATLANLTNAYRYLGSLDPQTKDQEKLQKEIVTLISKKGLFARKRDLVNLECARALGDLGDDRGAAPLRKWLENVLDDKSPNPMAVEYGFRSLAWIGADDRQSLDFAIDYATKGKHPDPGVAAQAIRACKEWRKMDGKDRKEAFDKICGYLQGLYSKWKGGDAKQRGVYETRYKAVEADGMDALKELGNGTKWDEPNKARDWFNDNKKRKWEDYVGPKFRVKEAPPAEKPEEGGDKPEG